ncbi:MAG: type II toxin-antitoxin system RelE/ParE family toxin [Oscillospiraceae bacterium]|jgi:mRNA interferase RelE/StbE|nr:type II toxin-antitoxin system RelE/ParE family toxin [Oscillospiraceae bacterium]
MGYNIILGKKAKKYLDAIPQRLRERIAAAIDKLPDGDVAPMQGRSGFRLVVGGYRVKFSVDHMLETIDIIDIGPRGDIYK